MNGNIHKERVVNQTVKMILQDFADLTGLACIYIDIYGKEQSAQYRFCDFCRAMRNNPACRCKCNQCDLSGSMAVLQQHRFCPHRCHAGLVDFSMPIFHEKRLHGFVLAGQTRIDDVRIPTASLPIASRELEDAQSLYHAVPQYSYSHLRCAMRMLYSMTMSYFSMPMEAYSLQEIKANLPVAKRVEIQRVVKYIQEHVYAPLSLRTLAEEVYLSEAYLSKLFKEEMHMNLTRFIMQCRMEEAKRLLQTSTISIELLSRKLGYNRPSYFCKLFKEYTGDTPLGYRKQLQTM